MAGACSHFTLWGEEVEGREWEGKGEREKDRDKERETGVLV